MGYSFAYNNGSSPSGTTKFAKLQIGGDNQEYTTYGGLNWYASAPYNGKFLIVSDTYSQGWTNQESATPTFWRSANNALDSLKDLVNQLPDVNGVTGFTDVGGAINYINSTDKYLISQESDSYPEGDIVLSGLVLNLDAGYSNSYPKSGTTWYDIKGANYGTLINGPTFSADGGGSIVFDGTDDYIRTSTSTNISGNNPWTMEIFINVNSSESGGGRKGWMMWEGPNGQSQNTLLSVGVNSGYVEVAHWSNDTMYTNSPINFNNWQHIVVTYDNNVENVYINGDNTNTKTVGPLNISNGLWYLASRSDSDTETRLNCKIGAFRIYNKELSASEVLQNYNAQKGRFGL